MNASEAGRAKKRTFIRETATQHGRCALDQFNSLEKGVPTEHTEETPLEGAAPSAPRRRRSAALHSSSGSSVCSVGYFLVFELSRKTELIRWRSPATFRLPLGTLSSVG